MLEKFIAGDFIAIAGEMRRFPASNENTGHDITEIYLKVALNTINQTNLKQP